MKRRSDSGSSLIEVMITMVLLVIALMGLALSFPPGRAAVFQGRQMTRAAGIAEERLEIARRTAYADLTTLAGIDTGTYNPYTVTTAVAVDAPLAGMTTVTVTVASPGVRGPHVIDAGPQNVVLESFFNGS